MTLEDETTEADAAADAGFDAGFAGTEAEKPTEKTERPEPAETPRAEEVPAPEFVQITKADWEDMRATAAKAASHDQQLSNAFGTIGNLQKLITGLQSQAPRGGKIEISKEAFADLEKDFPELANSTRAALEKALSGIPGTGNTEPDDARLSQKMAEYATARETEALEDAHPDWRVIVGAPTTERPTPDPETPFRKWLATKDATYQARVNGTVSAVVLERAINRFQSETKQQAKPTTNPRAEQRREQIAAAVQPKGDGAAPKPRDTEEDAFQAGWNSA